MAIKTVTFEDKHNLNANPNVARINKVTDDDMNQLKNVANTNANNVGDLSTLNTTDKTSLVNAINEVNNSVPVITTTSATSSVLTPNNKSANLKIPVPVGKTPSDIIGIQIKALSSRDANWFVCNLADSVNKNDNTITAYIYFVHSGYGNSAATVTLSWK